MSEADARGAPSRGRSSTRGGRGGFGRGGPRGGRKPNGTSHDTAPAEEPLEEQGEIGEMKKKYLVELGMLKAMFPDGWSDTDLVFALEENGGDPNATAEKIMTGEVSQFSEVKKPKDRARSKVKDDSTAAGAPEKPGLATRGSRGRGGLDSVRGGRGRGSDRGRGGHRGGRGGHATTNGTAKETAPESVPTTESSAWDNTATTTPADDGWDSTAPAEIVKDTAEADSSAWSNVTASEPAPTSASETTKSTVIPESGSKKSWASIFAKPKPAPVPVPVPQKQILTKAPPPAELAAPVELAAPAPVDILTEEPKEPTPTPLPPAIEQPEEPALSEPIDAPAERPATSEGEDLNLTPSKDPLTEENVEHLPDESVGPATHTVASTTGSVDPRNLTPLPSQPVPIGRPPLGGYAATANRLAGTGGRSASFQRRVQEQQEAVVMPGHNALDRAAVQFGSMGLNGEPGLDVDEEREEPETRQPPQHSPPSQPRTSLPPAPRQAAALQDAGMPEAVPTPKQAPGLPPASAQNQQQIQDPSLTQALPQEQQIHQQAYSQYGRYAQPGMPQDTGAQQQKSYDAFTHQGHQNHFDHYGAHSQQPQQQQSAFGGLSSAPSDYSSYYTSDQPRQAAYNQYYGSSFGPQDGRGQQTGQSQAQAQHDAIGPQRSTSSFGAGPHDGTFASQTPSQAPSRFSEAPGSGNNTPNPLMAGPQQGAPNAQQQSQHAQHGMHQQAQNHQQGGGAGGGYASAASGFGYGHPYYNSPYPTAYQNQFGYTPPVGYGGGYPGKQGGMYGSPHGYGMGSQSSYDQHSSSPANASAFSQNQQSSMRSASGMATSGLGGLEDYGRGSTQTTAHQQSSGFGTMTDPFTRSTSGFGQGGYGQQSIVGGQEDSLKPFGDAKNGPSPSLGQPGRPGSAANSAAGTAQSGLPPPQNQHAGFGGYQGFQGQASQYGSLGGLGGHQQQSQGAMGGQQQSAYGSYGGGFNQTYGSYGASRGGWGANYSGH